MVIGRSLIQGAGLGLFAFVPMEARFDPKNKKNWVVVKKIGKKYRLFKGYPQKDRKTTHIDEYLGTHIVQKTPELLTKLLDKTKTGKAVLLTKTHAIDAENPTDCYAAYANDPRPGSGIKYNAALISSYKDKQAAIIAIADIFVDDEIYVDYGEGYWTSQKTVGKGKKQGRKKQKQISGVDYADV